MDNIFIIIPAYNECKNIGDVLSKVKKKYSNIIVVDDGSKDRTFETSKSYGVTVLRHIINLGKGAALKTGCEYALKKGANKIVVIDSDGQHKPQDIPRFLKELDKYDVVLGYRELDKNMPFILKFGNSFINFTTRVLYNISVKDTQSGFRAFTSDAYKKIKWASVGYSVESEMIANIGKSKLKFKEIPIETIYNDKYKGTTPLDGVKIVINMFLWRLRR